MRSLRFMPRHQVGVTGDWGLVTGERLQKRTRHACCGDIPRASLLQNALESAPTTTAALSGLGKRVILSSEQL